MSGIVRIRKSDALSCVDGKRNGTDGRRLDEKGAEVDEKVRDETSTESSRFGSASRCVDAEKQGCESIR